MKKISVLIMAGGTGGHVFPGLAVAQALRIQGAEVRWLGSLGGLESRWVPSAGIPLHLISVAGLRGKGWRGRIQGVRSLAQALWQSWRLLRELRPQVVLGMGGFVAGPGGLLSRLLGLPLVIHEQNAVPGLTNRWLARWANRVFAAFPDSFAGSRVEVCGNPVRQDIVQLAHPFERLSDRESPRRLLVLGGSQGARTLNQTLVKTLSDWPVAQRPLIRHQAGVRHLEETRALYEQAGVAAEVTGFIDDMAAAYGWADLVLCRAGALTLAEIMAAGVAAVLVPYPHAVDDHQTRNAEYLLAGGAARLLPEHALDGALLSRCLHELLDDPAQTRNMAARARELFQPGAAERIAQCCIEVART